MHLPNKTLDAPSSHLNPTNHVDDLSPALLWDRHCVFFLLSLDHKVTFCFHRPTIREKWYRLPGLGMKSEGMVEGDALLFSSSKIVCSLLYLYIRLLPNLFPFVQVGLEGEYLGLDKISLANNSLWIHGSSLPINKSLIWYKVYMHFMLGFYYRN